MTSRRCATGVLGALLLQQSYDRDLLDVRILVLVQVGGKSVAHEGGGHADARQRAQELARAVIEVDPAVSCWLVRGGVDPQAVMLIDRQPVDAGDGRRERR